MKKIFFSCLILLFSNLSHAQSVFYPTYGNFDILGRRFVINDIIDARPDKEIGFIETDSTKIEKLFFDKNIDEILIPFLERCAGEKPEKPINTTIKINAYKLGTRKVEDKIWVWLYFDLEFFMKNDDKFVKIGEVNNIVEGKGEKFVSLLLGKTHWAFWRQVITILNSINPKKIKKDSTNTFEFISKEPRYLHPILTDSTYHDGIYWSYNDFLQNKPRKDLEFKVEKKDWTNTLHIKQPDGKFEKVKRVEEYWGYCKENVVYICVPNENYNPIFLPIGRFGNTFEIVDNSDLKFETFSDRLTNYSMSIASTTMNVVKPFSIPSAAGLGFAVGGILLSSLLENPSPRPYLAMKSGQLIMAKLYRF